MRNTFTWARLFLILALSNATAGHAAISKNLYLVGEVLSFKQNQVRVKSGQQEFKFPRNEVDHPNYAVGTQIEIPYDKDKMNLARVKSTKPKH